MNALSLNDLKFFNGEEVLVANHREYKQLGKVGLGCLLLRVSCLSLGLLPVEVLL